ncbi:MAG: hypothetical protein MMC33_004564 [Icmadophila ericetorum]|nr:hypothetical protein [Icmadophila ericetorum]
MDAHAKPVYRKCRSCFNSKTRSPSSKIALETAEFWQRGYMKLWQSVESPNPQNSSIGLYHTLCLVTTETSLGSVLNFPIPTKPDPYNRENPLFVVAVSVSDGDGEEAQEEKGEEEGEEPFTGHFNVAVKILLDDLFACLGYGMKSLDELARQVSKDGIWYS